MKCTFSGCNKEAFNTTNLWWNGLEFILNLCHEHFDRYIVVLERDIIEKEEKK